MLQDKKHKAHTTGLFVVFALVAGGMSTTVAKPSATEEIKTAHTYVCNLKGATRRVEVNYPQHVLPLPCEVNYYKDDEAPGESQQLWHASAQMGYCEVKADKFVNKLENYGWDCE